jgi:hypothetical protein
MLEHAVLGTIAKSEESLHSRAQAKQALAEGGSTEVSASK